MMRYNHTAQLLSDCKKYPGIGRGHFVEVYEVKKCVLPYRQLRAARAAEEEGYVTYPDGQRRRGRWTRYSNMSLLMPSFDEPTDPALAPGGGGGGGGGVDGLQEGEIRRLCSDYIAQTQPQNMAACAPEKAEPLRKSKISYGDISIKQTSFQNDQSEKRKYYKKASSKQNKENELGDLEFTGRSLKPKPNVSKRKISDPNYSLILAPALCSTMSLALPVYGLYNLALGSGLFSAITSGL